MTSISTPASSREQLRVRERGLGLLLGVEHRSVERLVERDADHVDGDDGAALLLGKPEGRAEHLLADQADLHRDENPLVGAFDLGNEVSYGGRHPSEDPFARHDSRAGEDDGAEGEPDRAGDPSGVVCEDRSDPDRERERCADKSRNGHRRPSNADVARDAERPLELRFA